MHSARVDVSVKRNGEIYHIAFADGKKIEELEVVGTCGRRTTDAAVRFWPNAKYFDSAKFSVFTSSSFITRESGTLSGLEIKFIDKVNQTEERWCQDGLSDYLLKPLMA